MNLCVIGFEKVKDAIARYRLTKVKKARQAEIDRKKALRQAAIDRKKEAREAKRLKLLKE